MPDIEVLEFAIARELEAYHFYSILAAQAKAPAMRQTIEEIAAEELQHKESLELEIIKTGQTVKIETVPSPKKISVTETEGFKSEINYLDLLLIAIDKEETAFTTYIDMLDSVSDDDTRQTLLAIAQQEAIHKYRFELEYNTLLDNS